MTKDEAIKDIEENILPVVGGKSLRMAIDALKQAEHKTGKWIEITDHEIPIVCKCTECGWLTTHYDSFVFCPNCGADMRGDAHE